jgi:hypothetical protein
MGSYCSTCGSQLRVKVLPCPACGGTGNDKNNYTWHYVCRNCGYDLGVSKGYGPVFYTKPDYCSNCGKPVNPYKIYQSCSECSSTRGYGSYSGEIKENHYELISCPKCGWETKRG